jgi:hypothetical protein
VRVGHWQTRATRKWSYIYRNSIRACRKWILYAAKRVLKWFYAIARRENCKDTRATPESTHATRNWSYNIGLIVGQIESESCIQQNANEQEVTQSRDATVDIYVIIYMQVEEKKGLYIVSARDCENRTFRLAALSLIQYSIVQYTQYCT